MMMFGMFGFGLIVLLLLIAIPVLFIWLIVGGSGLIRRTTQTASGPQVAQPVDTPAPQQNNPAKSISRQCANCGAGLQVGWSHCPQCGAPVN